MSVFDPFVCHFDHWAASEEAWPVVCTITNHSRRSPNLPPSAASSLRKSVLTGNESKALNPAIGAGGDAAFREWQQRVQSYHMNRSKNKGRSNTNHRESSRNNSHLPRPSGQGGRSSPNYTPYPPAPP